MHRRFHAIAGALTALALLAGTGEAQELKRYSATRQFHGEVRLNATIEFAAGTLDIGAGAPSSLYSMDLTYDASRFQPVNRWNAGQGAVTLGVAGLERGSMGVSGNRPAQVATVRFSPQADLNLSLAIGAAASRVDFGGLRLSSLALETGASDTEVRFSTRNAMRCTEASFRAGAASLTVLGLGNSLCDRVTFEGGVGSVVLDYAGVWAADMELQAKLAVGGLTLRLPRSLGVTITTERFLASFEPAGFTRQGNRYTSENNATAARHLDVTLTTSLGGVAIEWID
ncbi:MAG TPA: hypothetical protein VFV65_04365 [Gemmatimonadales bacterium]|nr:hypothetical protein [Gemmatimonadales bacterium]